MTIYVDIPSRTVVDSASLPRPTDSISLKRGDCLALEVVFLVNGTPTDLASGATGTVGLKETGDYSGNYLASASSWTWAGAGTGSYTFSGFNLNTTEINALFSRDESDAPAMLEIEWVESGFTTRSNTVPVDLQNNVNQGDEGVPVDGNPPYPLPQAIELIANKGQPNGYAGLDANGKVPVGEMPASLAPLASPAFTGTPTAPTPSAGDNSTNIATTAFATTIAAESKVADYSSPNRFLDAHAGWKLGDIVYDEGAGVQASIQVTVNEGFPGDGNDHDISFWFEDVDQTGGYGYGGQLYYSAVSAAIPATQIASDLATAINNNISCVSAAFSGTVVTVTWNTAGTFNNNGGLSEGDAYQFYSQNEGYSYPAEISDSVISQGQVGNPAGLYEVTDTTNLNNASGYAVLLSAIPTPDLSSPGPIGNTTPSSGAFTTLTADDGGYGSFPVVSGSIYINPTGCDWGQIQFGAQGYGADSYARWCLGMYGNGVAGTRGTLALYHAGVSSAVLRIDPVIDQIYLGKTSSPMLGLLSAVKTWSAPSIAANGGQQSTTLSLTGATTSSMVNITLQAGGTLPAGVIVGGQVTTTNTVTITLTNCTGSAVTPGASLQFRATIINF